MVGQAGSCLLADQVIACSLACLFAGCFSFVDDYFSFFDPFQFFCLIPFQFFFNPYAVYKYVINTT